MCLRSHVAVSPAMPSRSCGAAGMSARAGRDRDSAVQMPLPECKPAAPQVQRRLPCAGRRKCLCCSLMTKFTWMWPPLSPTTGSAPTCRRTCARCTASSQRTCWAAPPLTGCGRWFSRSPLLQRCGHRVPSDRPCVLPDWSALQAEFCNPGKHGDSVSYHVFPRKSVVWQSLLGPLDDACDVRPSSGGITVDSCIRPHSLPAVRCRAIWTMRG